MELNKSSIGPYLLQSRNEGNIDYPSVDNRVYENTQYLVTKPVSQGCCLGGGRLPSS